MKRNTLFIPLLLLLMASMSSFSHQPLIKQRPLLIREKTIIILTFKGGIQDCPKYGMQGTFIDKMLKELEGEIIEEKENKLYIQFNVNENTDIKQRILDYVNEHHYPSAYVFDVTSLNDK